MIENMMRQAANGMPDINELMRSAEDALKNAESAMETYNIDPQKRSELEKEMRNARAEMDSVMRELRGTVDMDDLRGQMQDAMSQVEREVANIDLGEMQRQVNDQLREAEANLDKVEDPEMREMMRRQIEEARRSMR